MFNLESENTNSELIEFSILVCTLNGEFRLNETLKYLDNLIPSDKINHEVIVIDNSSSDNTESVFREFTRYSRDSSIYNYISVLQKGKFYALKKGVEISKYKWIIVCDDDNLLMPDFLIIARSLILKYIDVVAFGSKSILHSSTHDQLPLWFQENTLRYACGEQYPFSGYVSYKQDIWGAGSIYLKSSLEVALFSQDLILTSQRGEDTEIFYRIILQGLKVYYSNDLIIMHSIANNRLNFESHIKMLEHDKFSRCILNKYNAFIKYYFLNKRPNFTRLKWCLLGLINRLMFSLVFKDTKYEWLVNIYTPFGHDKHFKAIKRFYSSLN